jgi:hypothetical protein
VRTIELSLHHCITVRLLKPRRVCRRELRVRRRVDGAPLRHHEACSTADSRHRRCGAMPPRTARCHGQVTYRDNALASARDVRSSSTLISCVCVRAGAA